MTKFLITVYPQRVPKLQAEDQAVWWDTLTKMQKLLRKAAQSLFSSGQFDKDTMHSYFMSGNFFGISSPSESCTRRNPVKIFKMARLRLLSFLVTEREVINGILNVKNTKNHCMAYVRYINNINLQNLKKASLFVDIINRSLDTEASKLLANLRDERLPNKIESTNMQKYNL